MLTDYWPIHGLRITTPRLTLRPPSDDDLADLADLAAAGVHDPERMPFSVAWTDLPPHDRGLSVLQHAWRLRAEWKPERWSLQLAVVEQSRVVGVQDIGAHRFDVLREVSTGSWLGREHHGRGIGTEMRAAVLSLAFDGLQAEAATSEAFTDNPASYAISRRLGYQDAGFDRLLVRERPVISRRPRLTRERWADHRTLAVHIGGLDACRAMFGLSPESEHPGSGPSVML